MGLDDSNTFFKPLVERISVIYFGILKISSLKESSRISPKLFYKIFSSLTWHNLMFVNSEVAQNIKAEQAKQEEQQKLKENKNLDDSHPETDRTNMPSAYNTQKSFKKKKELKSSLKINETEDSEAEGNSDEEKDGDKTKEQIEGEGEGEKEEGENDEEKSVSEDSVFKIPFTLEEIRADIINEKDKLENRYEQLIELDEYIPMATLKI